MPTRFKAGKEERMRSESKDFQFGSKIQKMISFHINPEQNSWKHTYFIHSFIYLFIVFSLNLCGFYVSYLSLLLKYLLFYGEKTLWCQWIVRIFFMSMLVSLIKSLSSLFWLEGLFSSVSWEQKIYRMSMSLNFAVPKLCTDLWFNFSVFASLYTDLSLHQKELLL